MTIVLWREPWLKPLTDMEISSEVCAVCKKGFQVMDFVTSCEFCTIGVTHEECARKHILHQHKALLDKKVVLHRDKRLHDYQ